MKAFVFRKSRMAFGIGARKVGDDITVVFAERRPEDVPKDAVEIEVVERATIKIGCNFSSGHTSIHPGTMSLPGQ